VARLERAFNLVVETQPIHDRLRKLGPRDWREAWDQGLLSEAQRSRLEEAERAVAAVVAVDDFAPETLSPRQARRAPPARAGAAP